MSEDRTAEEEDAPGRRLERYIRERLPRGKGGIRGFCKRAGIMPEVAYSWFRGDTEPQLGSLTKIADELKIPRAEVLAAMDGQRMEPTEAMVRRIAREEQERVLTDAIASGRLQVPPAARNGRRRGGATQ